jgi:cell division protease FtsH
MSELGPICLKNEHATHSEALLARVEETTRRLLDDQLTRARRIVTERRDEIGALVDALLERETLDAAEIAACFPKDAKAEAA